MPIYIKKNQTFSHVRKLHTVLSDSAARDSDWLCSASFRRPKHKSRLLADNKEVLLTKAAGRLALTIYCLGRDTVDGETNVLLTGPSPIVTTRLWVTQAQRG